VGVWRCGGVAAAGAKVLTAFGLSERIAAEQAMLQRVATLLARAPRRRRCSPRSLRRSGCWLRRRHGPGPV
jgi:hypothetical protein